MTKPVAVGALALGAALVLGFGVWLGRSASPSQASQPAAGSAPTNGGAEPAPAAAPVRPGRASVPPPPSVRRSAPTGSVEPGLAADLRDHDPKVRRAAVKEAAADKELDPQVLLVASRDPDLEVGILATEALGRRYADGSVAIKEMIARATDKSLHERVRTSALNGLGLVSHPDAAATLVRLLATGEVFERRGAAILLVHQEAALAIPALIEALTDADEVVRDNALASLRSRSRGRDFGPDPAAWRRWWQSRSR
ncbi:MAG: HEAT repeat domain-containing protein [Deltaproteobacteria bacterium]|nr:HEAT repeat domain-containing protein [Deltaproteobacteria bacterium]MCW5802594.1 HEAT repeat domain-containing protein [Deltaproteobacteria bacterium]